MLSCSNHNQSKAGLEVNCISQGKSGMLFRGYHEKKNKKAHN
jgi:hypothetical protein